MSSHRLVGLELTYFFCSCLGVAGLSSFLTSTAGLAAVVVGLAGVVAVGVVVAGLVASADPSVRCPPVKATLTARGRPSTSLLLRALRAFC